MIDAGERTRSWIARALSRGALAAIALAAVAGLAPQRLIAAEPQPLPADVLHVQRVQIMDDKGFEKPLVAATVMIPVGWRAEGGVQWGALGECGVQYPVSWKATSADGESSIALVPVQNFEDVRWAEKFGAMPSRCPRATFTSAREFLEALARNASPQGKVLEFRPRPDIIHARSEELKRLQATELPMTSSEYRYDAGELVLADSVEGRETRALFRTELLLTHARMMDLVDPKEVAMEMRAGAPSNVMVARAPAATFDPDTLQFFVRASRQEYDWAARIVQFNRRALRQKFTQEYVPLEERQKRLQRELLEEKEDIARLRETAYSDAEVRADAALRERIEAAREVEIWDDTASGEGRVVQFDRRYAHVWRVNDGTYLLARDPAFVPGKFGFEARKLDVVK